MCTPSRSLSPQEHVGEPLEELKEFDYFHELVMIDGARPARLPRPARGASALVPLPHCASS